MLIGKLVELPIGACGERGADEICQIEAGVGDVFAFALHPVGQIAGLLIAPMRPDEIGIVDIAS